MRRITLISTGGTIEKTYDERTGELSNRQTIVQRMLGELRIEDAHVVINELMSKDSLDFTDGDRERIVDAVKLAGAETDDPESCCGVVVLHGTDTLDRTGMRLYEQLRSLRVPVILTGAWRPFEMKQSDALQNLTEALFAVDLLDAGVYCVAHGRALAFPGVRKNRERRTFEKAALPTSASAESSAGAERGAS